MEWEKKGKIEKRRSGLDSPQITWKVTTCTKEQHNTLTREAERDWVDPLSLSPSLSFSLSLSVYVCLSFCPSLSLTVSPVSSPSPPPILPSLLARWVCCRAGRVKRASADRPSFFLCLLLLGHLTHRHARSHVHTHLALRSVLPPGRGVI